MTKKSSKHNPFSSIPQKKIDNAIEEIKKVYLDKNTGKLSGDGAILVQAINNYADANVPTDYWFREMQDFEGDRVLLNCYEELTHDLDKSYNDGLNYVFAGSHGLGKTMAATCMLKRVLDSGKYDALYVNLTDIVNMMASKEDQETKSEAREILLSVDFLVIDEFDSRFMGTDNAIDLFGRLCEPVIRARIQNKLPTILCTNNTNPDELFNGALKMSFKSLMKKMKTIPVLGKDHRKK